MKVKRYLLVAGVGAAVGLLLAPKKGSELRRELEQRLGPLLSGLGLLQGSADQVTMSSGTPMGDELQSKIEETRRRLHEQREETNPS
jgi:gas vesicle protein